MNTPAHSSGERKLRDALENRSDVMSESTLDLGAVHQQARGIRRRRRIGTGLAAAAVVAVVALPVGLTLGLPGDDKGGPAPAGSGTPSPTSTATPRQNLAADADAARQALEAVERGEDPAIDYAFDGMLHGADGSTSTLPETTVPIEGVTWYHGGPLLITPDAEVDAAGSMIRQFDLKGNETESAPGSPRLAVSRDGARLAWWEVDQAGNGSFVISSASGMGGDGGGSAGGTPTGDVTYAEPIGFTESGDLVAQVTTEGGPGVVVNTEGSEPQAVDALSTAGGVEATNGWVSGQLAENEGLTGAVVDLASGDVVWSKEGWRLGKFSPDGRYVIGFHGGADPQPIQVLDAATGNVVEEFDLRTEFGAGYVDATGLVWEDDDSLLVATYVLAGTDAENHAGTVLRLDVDGSIDRAAEVDDGAKGNWVFGPRP